MQEYEHLYFNEDIHISIVFNYTAVRQSFLKELRQYFPVEKLHLDPGSGIGATIFIISENRSLVEMMTSATKCTSQLISLENRIPEYHISFLRQSFSNLKYFNLSSDPYMRNFLHWLLRQSEILQWKIE